MLGYFFIRRKKIQAHNVCMLSAFAASSHRKKVAPGPEQNRSATRAIATSAKVFL